jgi:hypothetical protein
LANNTQRKTNSASSAASSALTAAEEASLKTRDLEVLMYLLDILSKLKMLDFLRFNNANTTRESYLNSYFLKLNNSFKKCKGSKISPVTNIIFKECCIDFVITLYQLEIYATPNRLLLTNITELIKVVNDLINTDNDNLNNAYDNVIGILENIATTMPATEVLETS